MKKKIILILSCMILIVAFIVINRYWLYDLDREKIRPIITKYLEEKVAVGVSEKRFCSYQELGAEKISDSEI